MLPIPLHLATRVLVLLVAVLAFGACGSDDPRERPGDRDGSATSGSTTQDSDDELPAPTPSARAEGAVLDELARAFAPVSERINFLVTAETLRADALESRAGEDVQQERAGVVRIESKRMEGILDAARARVAAVRVRTTAQQQVQQLLLEAIDARRRAMPQLRAALQAEGKELPDSLVEERFATWRASWDASLRATREATSITQQARLDLGLEPAPEEALR